MTILPVTGAEDDTERVRAAAVDGFIVWTTADDDPVIAAVQAMRRPAVVHGGPAAEGLGLVTIDNRAAAREIGRVAFAAARRPAVLSFPLSRERAGMITRGPDTDVPFPVTRHRLQGYRQAAADAGLAWDDVAVAVCTRNDPAEAERLTATLLAGPEPPDAIAAMGDTLASGVIRAVHAAGRTVPGDVAVTGWDDAAVAADLGLTTVAQSLREQGSTCARAALGEEIPGAAAWHVVRRSSTR